MPEKVSKSRAELIVELIKALAWPLFALIVLICFWSQLQSASRQLPNLLSRSETISIAGLSLKIGKGLSKQPSTNVKKALSELSPDGIQRLLNLSSSSWWDVGSESTARAEYAELVHLGLMEEVSESEIRATNERDGKNFGYAVRVTAFGKETQTFLYALISEFVQELERSGGESTPKEQ